MGKGIKSKYSQKLNLWPLPIQKILPQSNPTGGYEKMFYAKYSIERDNVPT